MTKDEALKQAVYGLERILGTFEKNGKVVMSSMIRNELFDEVSLLLKKSKKALAQPVQKPDYWLGHGLQAHTEKPFDDATPLYTAPPQPEKRNFCSRCGKRTADIHTCTPPQENA